MNPSRVCRGCGRRFAKNDYSAGTQRQWGNMKYCSGICRQKAEYERRKRGCEKWWRE